MIAIVTVSTVSTVSTVAVMGLTAALSTMAAVVLILFLVARESIVVSNAPRLKLVARFLSVGIIPLLMAFATIAVLKMLEVLGST